MVRNRSNQVVLRAKIILVYWLNISLARFSIILILPWIKIRGYSYLISRKCGTGSPGLMYNNYPTCNYPGNCLSDGPSAWMLSVRTSPNGSPGRKLGWNHI